MKRSLFGFVVLLVSVVMVSDADAGLLFNRNHRIRIFRPRNTAQVGEQSVIAESAPATPSPATSNGPAAPDVAPATPVVAPAAPTAPVDSGPAAPAVQSSKPEGTAPTLGIREDKAFRLLNPKQIPPTAPTLPQIPVPTPVPQPVTSPNRPDFSLTTDGK